jgi:hypothetical protein
VFLQITKNTTQCLAECFAFSDKLGQRYCSVVLKATYDVKPDGRCEWAAKPFGWIYADDHHGDPGSTAIRYESDFAPVKPRIDVLINGFAIAPGGRAVESMLVTIEGPGLRKEAQVTGNRTWTSSLWGIEASSPQHFVHMPLVWHRAFGGSDLSHNNQKLHGTELRNPVGVGFHLNNDRSSILGCPLPNIEHPRALIRKWPDRPEPVGFSPLGRGWMPRVRFGGTYDRRWMEETRPFLPENFDERYFLSAPHDQQLDELPADSVFVCHNMSEDSRFVVQIPSLTVPVRYVFDDHVELCRALPDTVLLEPHERRLVMLGRVQARLPRKLTALREIQVGPTPRTRDASKPHYSSLGQAVAALSRRA